MPLFPSGSHFQSGGLDPAKGILAISDGVPNSADALLVTTKTAIVFYTVDDTTTPTATVGHILPLNETVRLAYSDRDLRKLKFFSATGTLDLQWLSNA